MKKSIILALVAAVMAVSCEKTGVDVFTGSYTYKISGSIGVMSDLSSSDTTFVNLDTEQGQMNIVKDNSTEKLVITWNDMLGEASHTTAVANGSKFTLEAGKKLVATSTLDYPINLSFSGEGKRLDNMLIMTLDYSGSLTIASVEMKVVSSNVECIAKKNE